MCEFRNLLNTFASHITADNIESFIKFTEHLITLGSSIASGKTNAVEATVDVLSTVGDLVATPKVPTPPSTSSNS